MHQPRVYGSAAKTEEKLRIPGETDGAPEGFPKAAPRTSHKPEDDARHGEQSIGSRSVQLQIGAHASRGPVSPFTTAARRRANSAAKLQRNSLPTDGEDTVQGSEMREDVDCVALIRQSWPRAAEFAAGLAGVRRAFCLSPVDLCGLGFDSGVTVTPPASPFSFLSSCCVLGLLQPLPHPPPPF